jgi:hypothetical protein
MLSFTLIAEFNSPRAVICDADPNPGQRSILFGLLPDPAFNYPDLAARWEVAAVLCTPKWRAEQLSRVPMLRPAGQRLAFLASLVFALCHLTSAMASPPTQGAAAADLVRKVARRSAIAPPATGALQSAMPPAVPQLAPRLVSPVSTQTWYFAATAVATNGLESDFSSEVIFGTTNRHVAVTLAWDPSPGTNTGLRYNIYTGGASRTYTNTTSAGTNLTLTVSLYPPALTNTLLTVTGTLGATNLAWASSLRGPWTLLGTTNYVGTNVPSPRFYRGVGKQGNKVTIKSTHF